MEVQTLVLRCLTRPPERPDECFSDPGTVCIFGTETEHARRGVQNEQWGIQIVGGASGYADSLATVVERLIRTARTTGAWIGSMRRRDSTPDRESK